MKEYKNGHRVFNEEKLKEIAELLICANEHLFVAEASRSSGNSILWIYNDLKAAFYELLANMKAYNELNSDKK